MISVIIKPESNGQITLLDAGIGEGKAVNSLREEWLKKDPTLNVYVCGVESDKNRAEQAHELLSKGPGGGQVVWSAIEDTFIVNECSVLYFNPPFDKIRGSGRTEFELFEKVKGWPMRGGLIVMIVPDYVVEDYGSGIAKSFERDFELKGIFKYPEPEYQEFNQCVLIGVRRERALNKQSYSFPTWAEDPDNWPILGISKRIVAKTKAARLPTIIRRQKIGEDLIKETVAKSALRGAMLSEAIAPEPPIGRPLLPLRHGHLALALASGLCDGVIKKGKERFLIKGTLDSAIRKTGIKEKKNKDGEIISDVEIWKTQYEMHVRCLRDNGSIENYTSGNPDAEKLGDGDNGDDDDA
jgi:hypothetical protein